MVSACSLVYRQDITEDEESEIAISDLVMITVKNGKKERSVTAKQMEQYRKDTVIYAEDVVFTLYDKNEQTETEGRAASLKSENNEILYFSDGVELTSYKEDVHIEAQHLKVDTKLEQLTSSREDTIVIQYGIGENANTKLYINANTIAGSGVSNSIHITDGVSGLIVVDDTTSVDDSANTSTSTTDTNEVPVQ